MNRWDTLWLDVRLATMSGDGLGTIEAGALAWTGDTLSWVGSADDVPGAPEALARDVRRLGGRWVLPGLIDCHTHLVYAGTRADEFEQRLEGRSYAEIAKAGGGINATVRAVQQATEAELYRASAPRLEALMAEGVTTVEIKSGYGLATRDELKMLRVARALGERHAVEVVPTLLAAHAVPEGHTTDSYTDYAVRELIPACLAEGLSDTVDAFGEQIAFGPDQVARVFDAASQAGMRVRLHADQLSDQGGAALAARFGALSADHLEYAEPSGIAAMATSGTVAVLLPGAFYALRETKQPPIEAMRSAGAAMAVATDCNPGTSPMTSLLLAANMACTLFRLTPTEALRGITAHAAAALGFQDRGVLQAGRRADLTVWDVAAPAELCYSIGGAKPFEVVVGGRVRV